MRPSLLISFTILIFWQYSFAKDRFFNVGLQQGEIEFKTKDIVSGQNQRKISYIVMYPTGTVKSKNKLFLNDLFPVDRQTDAAKLRWKKTFSTIESQYPEFDSEKALSAIRHFYKTLDFNIYKNAIPQGNRKYPLLLFSPGAAGNKEDCIGLLKEIAKRGVIIVSLDHHQWEDGTKVIHSPVTNKFDIYSKNLLNIKEHAHHHMRAVDLVTMFHRFKQSIFYPLVDWKNVFLSGYSYGGHSAFYSIRFGTKGIKGYINFDGSFSPYNDKDHYNPDLKKENVHLLCLSDDVKKDSPKICDKYQLSEFLPDLKNELSSFSFKTKSGFSNIGHLDLTIFSLFEEKSQYLDFKNNRMDRLPSKAVWEKISRWTLQIIRP